MHITLFDPSLANNYGDHSTNLGDIIIYESVKEYLTKIFPQENILRISSHTKPSFNHLRITKKSQYTFFGGTNSLSSNLKKYNQWKIPVVPKVLWPIYFPLKDVVLMGVGWWQYQDMPTSYSSSYYKKSLSHKYLHSVRDSYTLKKMIQMGFSNVVNTGCPTMWGLNGMDVRRRKKISENCIFTLTDYKENPKLDNQLIDIILSGYNGKVLFFPQGVNDIKYISQLAMYKKYSERILIIDRDINEYINILNSNYIDYIGTRLHAGIKALQLQNNSLIVAVDNRTTEIAKDTGLPFVERNNIEFIYDWINYKTMFDKIRVPIYEINCWLKQFED